MINRSMGLEAGSQGKQPTYTYLSWHVSLDKTNKQYLQNNA